MINTDIFFLYAYERMTTRHQSRQTLSPCSVKRLAHYSHANLVGF